MPEDNKNQPPADGNTAGAAPTNTDTGEQKSVNDVLAEIRAENDKMSKRLKDQEDFINRQAGEIGELRKKVNPMDIPKDEPDDVVNELIVDLKAEGMDEDTARFNAKILAKANGKISQKREAQRMMHEVIDLVDEAMEDGKIDKAIFKENEAEIMSEFKARKLLPTARQNYKAFRGCYDYVVKRKAETLRQQKEQEDQTARDKNIAAGSPPPPGGKAQGSDDESSKTLEGIRSAGGKERGSVFF